MHVFFLFLCRLKTLASRILPYLQLAVYKLKINVKRNDEKRSFFPPMISQMTSGFSSPTDCEMII